MIHFYGMTYWMVEYLQATIDSLLAEASEAVHITIIENNSPRSSEFLSWGLEQLTKNRIQRLITSSTNDKGLGVTWAIKNFPPSDDEDFFVCSDMDLILPANYDWIRSIRNSMKRHVICGHSLSPENYLPPNRGWGREGNVFGMYFVGIKKCVFNSWPANKNIQDVLLLKHAERFGSRQKILTELYHLGWNIPKDCPAYWQEKLAGVDWQTNAHPTFTVYERDTEVRTFNPF
jgi:hypothetical protein